MNVIDNPRLRLVRHRRTRFNAENRLRGRLDPELGDVALAEVEAFAEELAAGEAARVFVAPPRRTVGTASAIDQRTACCHGLVHRMGDWWIELVDHQPSAAAVGTR